MDNPKASSEKVEPFLFAFSFPSGTMVQKGSDKMPEVDAIRAQLFALQDKEYRVFYSRLMPTLPPETVIGVRVPLLRKLAKQPGTAGASSSADTTFSTTSRTK